MTSNLGSEKRPKGLLESLLQAYFIDRESLGTGVKRLLKRAKAEVLGNTQKKKDNNNNNNNKKKEKKDYGSPANAKEEQEEQEEEEWGRET